MTQFKRFAAKHAILMAQIALNAIVGYVFLKLLAGRFGATAQKDVFDIAYSIPFLIMNIGGLVFAHAVITAHFSKLSVLRPHKAESVFATTLTCVLLGSAVLTAVCVVFCKPLTQLLAPGFEGELRGELEKLMLLLLPIVLSFSLCTLFSAASNAYGMPVSNELGALVSRTVVVVGLLLGIVGSTLDDVAIALSATSVLGLALLWFFLRKVTNLKVRFSLDIRDRDFSEMAWQAGGFFFVACVAQVAMTIMRRLATLDEFGTNAALTYALSILAPLGLLVGKPLSLAFGPDFARSMAAGDSRGARANLDRAVIGCLAVGITGAAIGTLFSVPLVRLLYGGGQFDEHAIQVTASLLRCLVWSLPGSIVFWAVLMPLVTMSRSHQPALIYIGGYLLQIAFMAALFPLWGRFALAWGYTLAASSQAVAAWFFVYRALDNLVSEAPLELAC